MSGPEKNDFQQFRGKWIERALDNRECSDGAVRLLVYCAHHFLSRTKRSFWPSQETIAKATGTPKRTVQKHLAELRDCGLIDIKRQGRDRPCIYVPIVDDTQITAHQETQNAAHHDSSMKRNIVFDDAQKAVSKTRSKRRPNTLKEPSEEPIEGGGAHQAPSADYFDFDFDPYAPDAAPVGASGAVERQDQFFFASENVSDFLQTLNQDDVIRAFDEAAHQKIVALAMYAPDPIAGHMRITRLLEMGELTLVTLAETLQPENCHARPA